jgi:hypothetical protein
VTAPRRRRELPDPYDPNNGWWQAHDCLDIIPDHVAVSRHAAPDSGAAS